MLTDVGPEQRRLFCRAVANMAAADLEITDEERTHIEDLIAIAGLADDEEARAEIERELENPGDLQAIVEQIEDPRLRKFLFHSLVEIACANGEIAPEERQKVLSNLDLFGVDLETAQALIDHTLQSIALAKQHEELMEKLLA